MRVKKAHAIHELFSIPTEPDQSGRQDLNLRPSGPKPDAPKNQVLIPTALATMGKIVAAHWPLLLGTIRQKLSQTTPIKIRV